ncbi:MAG TPA: 4-(cytidine 5'-diphospho)-2-C-methyl-D-erythritol kinase [Gemmatimonadaceae bacterium]|nr:4-(cytidine 5'-diphospho)-2-C-methyl-D-erythritol kinase [Gemmatimonadaceae bacterium]
MPTARVEAQAKLNLFLRILGREPSGYHLLETLFQRVSLADSIVVRTDVAGRSLDCGSADVGPVEDNLAWRAALAYREAAGWPDAFAIELTKNIPVGGGLGGGSADAGAVLRALNAMAPRRLADEALFGVARSLGADVPFLASTSPTAIGLVRGDVIVACPPPTPRDIILLVPPFGVSSRDAFGWYAATHDAGTRQPSRIATPASGIALATVEAALAARIGEEAVSTAPSVTTEHSFSWREIGALSGNDLQDVVVAHHPELAGAIGLLRAAGAPMAQMTGSGSAVFGVFPVRPAGGMIAIPPGFSVFHAQTLNRVAPVEVA